MNIKYEIQNRGEILSNNVLKVNSFLNHQLDPDLLNEMAEAWYQRYKDKNITKIVTIEASGIALGILTGLKLNVPVVFAKKSSGSNMGDCYHTSIHSFTKNKDFDVTIEKKFLNENDSILIIDDFLANGNATLGLINIIKQANAKIIGIGIAIEKGFQHGGDMLRSNGYDIYSLAIIDKMDPLTKEITFRD